MRIPRETLRNEKERLERILDTGVMETKYTSAYLQGQLYVYEQLLSRPQIPLINSIINIFPLKR